MDESWDPVDMPRTRRLGGSKTSSSTGVERLGTWCVSCASGERGGVRSGRLEIGDGGTKVKLSSIESARPDTPEAIVLIDMRWGLARTFSDGWPRVCTFTIALSC